MPRHSNSHAVPDDDLTRWVGRDRPEADTSDVCIKLLELEDDDNLGGVEKDNNVLKEVEKEVRVLSSINHPNVVAYMGRASKGETP